MFVCHASEDKDDFVRPLVERLREEHVEVWYDEFSLRVGDSLRRSIDVGLRQSLFGIVVLSPHFFEKQWSQWELDGLVARQNDGANDVILPIWHGIDRSDIMAYDIHGQIASLEGLVGLVESLSDADFVFLGDYINKGRASREVLTLLLELETAGRATVLGGNHEAALLEALDTGEVASFLRMGGAATIRSFVGPRVGPNVTEGFRNSFPDNLVQFLRRMPDAYEDEEVIATHAGTRTGKFSVSAHSYVGPVPRVGPMAAEVDTGCGSKGGILTAFFWPARTWVQVDENGNRVRSEIR